MRAREVGDLAGAERRVREALAIDDADLDSRLMLADVAMRARRPEDAVCIAREAAADAPRSADARAVLAAALRATGNTRAAQQVLGEALRLEPDHLAARNDLAALLIESGHREDAIANLRWVLKRRPEFAEAHGNLGIALHIVGRPDEALKHFGEALRLRPDDPVFLTNYALCLRDLDRLEEAEVTLRRACSTPGAAPAARVNLAKVLRDLGRPREGVEVLDPVLRSHPGHAEARYTAAYLAQDLGEFERARRDFDAAVAAEPASADARLARAMHLLATGDFEQGWPEYEARLDSHEPTRRSFPFPDWDGGSFAGKSVLVYAEQGVGDEIMFAGCFPDLLAEAERCVIECDPRLERLFRSSFPDATVFGGRHATEHPWLERAGAIDVKIAAGSLPSRYRRSRARFPARSGYLRADPGRVDIYRRRLAALGRGLKVGITWRGGLGKTRRAVRSLPLQALSPVLGVAGAQFVSLQHEPVADDLDALGQLRGAARVEHWPDAQGDFAELAALASALDVIVSVCNATVHLGGALGKPVIVMVPFSAEWRYLLAGDTMPWYPSVRLVRQQCPGEWGPVIDEVVATLVRPQSEETPC